MELTRIEIAQCVVGLLLMFLATKFILGPFWKWAWRTKISNFFIFKGYRESMRLLSGHYADKPPYKYSENKLHKYFFFCTHSIAKCCALCLLLTLLFYRPFADGICYKTANYDVGDIVVYEHELKEIEAFDENIMCQKTAVFEDMEFQPPCSSIQGIYTEDDMEKSEAYRLFKSYICGVSYIINSAQNGISTLIELSKS